MRKLLLLFLLCSCGTSYKVAPSTDKVAVKVAVATRAIHESVKRSAEVESNTQRTHVEAVTTAAHIDAALRAISASDYVTAAQELTAAKASNQLVQTMLDQSLRNLKSLGESLRTTEGDLVAAQADIAALKKEVDTLATREAKNQAIVDQVNWAFGIGSFIYGIKRILTFGFFGALALAAVGITLVCIGGPAGGFVLRMVGGLFKRK
jgi:hypothetical protein